MLPLIVIIAIALAAYAGGFIIGVAGIFGFLVCLIVLCLVVGIIKELLP